jgi:hypothetical protein
VRLVGLGNVLEQRLGAQQPDGPQPTIQDWQLARAASPCLYDRIDATDDLISGCRALTIGRGGGRDSGHRVN